MENQNNSSFNHENNSQNYNNTTQNLNNSKKKSKAPIIIIIVIIVLLLLGCLVAGIFTLGLYIFNNSSSKIQNSLNSISSLNNDIDYENANTNTLTKNLTTGNNIVASDDKVSNHNWKASDNSYLELNEDGTFSWYKDKTVTNDNYYTGIYTIKNGASAIVDISNYHSINYGQLFTNNNIKTNNIYYLNFSVTSRIIDGEERLNGTTDETHYMLYLYEGSTDTLEGVNLKSMNNIYFTRAD